MVSQELKEQVVEAELVGPLVQLGLVEVVVVQVPLVQQERVVAVEHQVLRALVPLQEVLEYQEINIEQLLQYP
jgi:hypothetical protein